MEVDIGNIMMAAFGLFITGCIGIISYFIRRMIEKMDTLEAESTQCTLKHAQQETKIESLRRHISETYATKTDMSASRSEWVAALQRVHDRLDDIFKQISTRD